MSTCGQIARTIQRINDTDFEKLKFVHKVRQTAARQLNRLHQDTQGQIGIIPGEDLRAASFERLNRSFALLNDLNLNKLFNAMRSQINQDIPLPLLGDNITLNAQAIRDWMQKNGAALAAITTLDLRERGLTHLSPEIAMLPHLQRLRLGGNPIHALPADFNWSLD
jgi:hypothetical protein